MPKKKESLYKIGLDIGSTTIKIIVLDSSNKILFHHYERHLSYVKMTTSNLLRRVSDIVKDEAVTIAITGSAGIGIAQWLQVPFVQEVISASKAIEVLLPETDVAVELGGEDAKVTYFGTTLDQRMNGTCAGGTGAFIDQMAILLKTDAMGLNNLAKVVNTGNAYGIPTMGVVAVGKEMERNARYFRLATRIIAKPGAHVVKCYYCDDFESVIASCPIPIVIAGGKNFLKKKH